MPPLPKACPKTVSAPKGVAFLTEDVFEKNIFRCGRGFRCPRQRQRSCHGLALNDAASRSSALQMHSTVNENDAFRLERRDDTMQGTRLGVGNAAARAFPGRETRTRD